LLEGVHFLFDLRRARHRRLSRPGRKQRAIYSFE
jgi:hypothetical protein